MLTHTSMADTKLFLLGALLTVLLSVFQFLLAMKKNPIPQQQQHSGRKSSKRSTLPNPLQVFPGCPGCPDGFRFGAWLPPSELSGFFSDFLRMSPDGGFDDVLLSKSLLAFSFPISCSSSKILEFSLIVAIACSTMISTSCSGANCIRISRSSSRGRFFSIIVIFRLECHTCQYPLT